MSQSNKKPHTTGKGGLRVRSRSGSRTPAKGKRKKLSRRDRIFAALAAAVLILAASVSSLAVVYLHSVKAREEAAAPNENVGPVTQAPVVPEKPAPVENTQPPAAPPPASKPVAVPASPTQAAQNRPAENRQVPNPGVPVAALPAGGITERPAPPKGDLVFVIDDVGYNLRDLEPFLKFSGPLTLAVLPGLSFSAEAARRIRAAGKEVFLHQPMEAVGGQDPGPGAIRTGMSREEIRALVNRNLDEIWPVAGINNHEGSRITQDEDAMETILALCRERGILFLDSRTTAETAAPKAARLLGMSIGERDVFVDNVQDRESMIGYINTGLARAGRNGSAIMIGHVWSRGLAPLLSEMYPGLREQGYTLVPASTVIGGTKQ